MAWYIAQPFIRLMSSTAIEPRLRKKTTRMARPIAASAAATVSTNSAKTWPTRSPEMGRERDEVDVHREQDQLDRHQDDDDVLAVEEDAEDAEREQDRGDGEIVAEADGHAIPSDPLPRPTLPDLDAASPCVRATWSPIDLALDVRLVAQRQHDGADHGDQQHQAGRLEE